ncbi:MAG: diguanylate cyclase [Proteobacteria bacterium]|nr:diguanylate cyclase [Pseudomonadota bacterium]MBU4295286.1 diguanylate cyclase [Pseudomonadota bacterium]MCG2748139.1 diguanylate cyclase [Desulfobulbaceae bacterium]
MQVIRNKILQCLYDYSNNDEKLITMLDDVAAEFGPKAFPVMFHVLTHLELSQPEAEEFWQEICQHRLEMGNQLGHNVNLRTAICDFFCSIHKSLQNPKVVEIHVFENTINTAKYDRLTGLYNRAYFDESLIREVARAKRYNTELSVLFLDIDNFKTVNDNHGHLAGDSVLKEMSQAIMGEIRAEDIASRYGGEEIVIILPETKKATGLILAERIRELIANLSLQYEGKSIPLTISGGLANFPIDSCDAMELVRFADMALLKAKALGKNNIQSYSPNKRRYVRIDFSPKILVKKISIDEPAESFTAQAKNLSLTGILFRSTSPCFAVGNKIQLQVPFDDFNVSVELLGTVVRIELTGTGQYEIGVSFLEMEHTCQNEVSQYLLKKLGQKIT